MDFGTFYRMRQMRGSERTRDMMTNDDINQSENFSQLPVQSSVQSDFDHPPHPQFNYDRGFEEDDANIYGDYSTGIDFCNDPSWEERDYGDLHRRRGTRGRGRTRGGGREMGPSGGRDFGNDPSWEFPEERDLGDLDGTRNERGRGRARGGGREMGPSGGRGRGSGPGRGWPSDSWADHVNPTRPWHNEGGDGWGAERRDIVEQRDSQNNSVDWNELEHEAELARPTTPDCPQYPSDSGIERYMTQRASSDVSVPAAAKGKEEQTLIHQKLERGDEKTDDHAGKNKSSQETSDQKSNNIPEDAVLVAWAEGITQDKLLEKDIVDDTEDMAVTQSQDPKRTAFNCCYCGVSSNSIYDFKDHVKGNLHKEREEENNRRQ